MSHCCSWGSAFVAMLMVVAAMSVAAEPKDNTQKNAPQGDATAIRAELEKLGCKVTDDLLEPTRPIVKVEFQPLNFKTGDVAKAVPLLKECPELRVMILPSAATDDDFKAVAELKDAKKFEDLSATDSQVTDAGLLHLKTLPALKKINVIGAEKVTPAGIKKVFAAIPSLEKVFLKLDDGFSR